MASEAATSKKDNEDISKSDNDKISERMNLLEKKFDDGFNAILTRLGDGKPRPRKRGRSPEPDTGPERKKSKTDHDVSDSENEDDDGEMDDQSNHLADNLLHDNDQNALGDDCVDGDSPNLAELEALLDCGETLAPEILPSVASIGNKVFATPITSTQAKEIHSKFLRPKNLEKLVVPKVNAGIWSHVQRYSRTGDLRLQTVQQHMIKAATATMQATEAAKKLCDKNCDAKDRKELPAKIIKCLVDATALLGRGSYDVSLIRRQKLRPCLKEKYTGLCNESVPVTEELFGDDVSKAAKDIRQTEDVCKDNKSGYSGKFFSKGKSHGYNNNYNNNNNSYYDNHHSKNGFGRRGKFQKLGWKNQSSHRKKQ